MESTRNWLVAGALAALCCIAGGASAAEESAAQGAAGSDTRLVRDGLAIEFETKLVEGAELMEGALAEFRFRVAEDKTGKPVAGLKASAWVDTADDAATVAERRQTCAEKIGLYRENAAGMRPLADLDGHFLLVLNRDPSISVVDPLVSLSGRNGMQQIVRLKAPGIDWAYSPEARRLFVTQPGSGTVAVVDTDTFEVIRDIPAGSNPTRTAMQPDGRYLWVGNNARQEADSGVTVIDAQSLAVAMQAATGRGHHEITFSPDSRRAFITNRDSGTLTVFDTGTLKKVKDIKTGSLPLSVAYSKLANAAYVSEARDGLVAVVDADKLEVVARIKAKPGLGPLRFTPDGRFAFVVNLAQSVVYVIDPLAGEILHTLPTQAEPFQVVFSRDIAYVRGLGSERVTTIELGSLGKGREPVVRSFAAGVYPPKMGGDLPLADAIVPSPGEATVFVVSPADNATYFYMEGMDAPMSGYQGRGPPGRAVALVDRRLREVGPGVLAGRVRLPAAGRYDVALSLEQPRLDHCFGTEVKANPTLAQARRALRVEFLPQQRTFRLNDKALVRFKIVDGEGKPRAGLKDVMVSAVAAAGSPPRDSVAREAGDGAYEAEVALNQGGTHFVHVSVPSLKLGQDNASFISLLVKGPVLTAPPTPPGGRP